MGLLDLIRGTKEGTMKDLCRSAVQLQTRLDDILAEQAKNAAELEGLQLEAVAEGRDPSGLQAAQARHFDLEGKKAAAEKVIHSVKEKIQAALPGHVKKQLGELGDKVQEARNQQKARLRDLHDALARAAVLLFQVEGLPAREWTRGGAIQEHIFSAINRDRPGFLGAVEKAKEELPGINLEAEIKALLSAQAELSTRPQDLIMVEEVISSTRAA